MPNIAVVVLDTLRKDYFDKYFDWLPGKKFENAWSTSNWTVPVHGSLFTGRYPTEIGMYKGPQRFNYNGELLTEKLKEAGYNTRGFSANPFISKRFLFDRGFSEFKGSWRTKHFNNNSIFNWDELSKSADNKIKNISENILKSLKTDYSVIKSIKYGVELFLNKKNIWSTIKDDGASTALKEIRKTNFSENEFFFLNLMEAHEPYRPPKRYRTVEPLGLCGAIGDIILNSGCLSTDIDQDLIIKAYEDSVKYLSDIYKKIFSELSENFNYIITLSDHGELLGEHGAWNHEYGLYPELTHIPLTIYKGNKQKTKCNKTVSILDIHKTILEIADIKGNSRGQNIQKDFNPNEYLVEFHGLKPQAIDRLKENNISKNIIEKYDRFLHGITCPKNYYGYETKGGFKEKGKSNLSNPKEKMTELIKRKNKKQSNQQKKLSKETLNHLKDLGYA